MSCRVALAVFFLLVCYASAFRASIAAEQADLSKLVDDVARDNTEAMILSGGRPSFMDLDTALKMPAYFGESVRMRSFGLAHERALTGPMKELVARQDAADQIHVKLKEIDPTCVGAGNLAIVLGKIGNRDSVPALIDLFQRAVEKRPAPADPAAAFKGRVRTQVAVNCSWALWELTGRKFAQSPEDWRAWWKSVEPYFETAAARKADRPLPEDFGALVQRLRQAPDVAREQLIAIGPAVVPELLKRISQEKAKAAIELCWIVNELGHARELPGDWQRKYFLSRFTTKVDDPANIAAVKDVRLRAFYQTPLADFCYIVMEADRWAEEQGRDLIMWGFMKLGMNDFRAKYGSRPNWVRDPSWQRLLDQQKKNGLIENLDREVVAKQVAAAVPVLVDGLKDKSFAVRRGAAQIAGMIGMTTEENPEALIVALRDSWIGESDEFNLGESGTALSRFESPLVNQALEKGLFLDDQRIVKTSADEIDHYRFPPKQFPKVYDRLEELTRHQDSRMRFAAARTLRSSDPKRLAKHLDRLKDDKDQDVRQEVCYAISKIKNPMYQGILIDYAKKQVADQADKNVRQSALSALADPAFDSAVDELLPLLEEEQLYGFVLSTIVDARQKCALPILMRLLEEGKDPANLVPQYLPRLSGENFKTPTDWLEWWRKRGKKKAEDLNSN